MPFMFMGTCIACGKFVFNGPTKENGQDDEYALIDEEECENDALQDIARSNKILVCMPCENVEDSRNDAIQQAHLVWETVLVNS